jgi:histidine triad (HIT) family protein
MEHCVFCDILKGKIPCHKVFEDDNVLAFLDINPANLGHTLVIPKNHFKDVYELSSTEFSKYMEGMRKTIHLLREKKGIKELNIISSNGKAAQQDIFHFHSHLIPRDSKDGINLFWENKKEMFSKDFKNFSEDFN